MLPTVRRGVAPLVQATRHQAPRTTSSQMTWKRHRTERAGPPMRSGWSGVKATVFGAYGQVGRYVVSMLGNEGTQCVIPFRGDDMEWRHLKVMGDYGNIVPMPFDPRDEDSMRRCIAESDVVINLIGKDYETTHYLPWLINYSFEDVHVQVAEDIARIATEEGANVLVHVSALAADKHSISPWARSKALGEEAVRAVCPGATIVRPSYVFGPEDRFLNTLARMYERLPRLPIVDGGERRVQPLYVTDLAKAIKAIAMSLDPDVCLSQEYDLAGPDVYTYKEVIEFVFETIRATQPDKIANVDAALAEAFGLAVGMFPTPMITRETFLRMQEDTVLDAAATTKRLHDLGIQATSMEFPGFSFLHGYRSGSHFLDVQQS